MRDSLLRFDNKLMGLGHQEKGVGKLTVLTFGLIAAATIYSAFQIIPFYYYYYELVNQMEAATGLAAIETDQELRRKLTYHIERMKLPVDPTELRIRRSSNSIRISLRYSEVFYFHWFDRDIKVYEFPFYAVAEGEY